MKKMFSKIIKVLFTFTIVINYFTLCDSVFAYSNGDLSDTNKNITLISNNHTSMQDGDASLTKSISVVDASQGLYRVNLSALGKNITTTHSEAAKLYIAIAFDMSSSMGKTEGSKFTNARQGVIKFVDDISSSYPNAEFALVTYASDSNVESDFTTLSNIKQKINSLRIKTSNFLGMEIVTPTSTHLGDGIYDAKNLLIDKRNSVSSTDPNTKYIMLVVGDGQPTGSGRNSTDQADDAKSKGIEIFSLGYDLSSDSNTSSNNNVLRRIASDPKDKHYQEADVNNIVNTLSGLTTNVSVTSPALINATITDVIGDDFVYANNKSGDDVVVNGQNVTINVGTVTETNKNYWFDIKINPDSATFKNNSWHNTNKSVSMTGTGTGGTLQTTDSASIYWQKKYSYSIEYYYDGEINSGKTVTNEVDLGETVSVTEEMINQNKDGYEYISTNPSSKEITVSETGDNVIKVYYESYKKLSITKTLENTDNQNKTFNIKITLKDQNDNLLNGLYHYKSNGNITELNLVNGEASFEIRPDETIEFVDIPKNTKYTVEEITTDGYAVQTCMSNQCYNSNVINGVLDSDKNITVINTASYELPETGASGMLIMIIIGSLLLASPVIYIGYNFYSKRKMIS